MKLSKICKALQNIGMVIFVIGLTVAAAGEIAYIAFDTPNVRQYLLLGLGVGISGGVFILWGITLDLITSHL